jgi:hypothetical protein
VDVGRRHGELRRRADKTEHAGGRRQNLHKADL